MLKTTLTTRTAALLAALLLTPSPSAAQDAAEDAILVQPGMFGSGAAAQQGNWLTPGNPHWPAQLVRWRAAYLERADRPRGAMPVIAWPADGQIGDELQSDACADQDNAWDPLLLEFMQRRSPGFGNNPARCMPYTLDRLDQSRPAGAFTSQVVSNRHPIAEGDVVAMEYARERLRDGVVDTRSTWTSSWIDDETGEPDGVHGPFIERGEYGLDGRLRRWTMMTNPIESVGRLLEWHFTWDELGRPVTASFLTYWHPRSVQAGGAAFDEHRMRYREAATPDREQHFVWEYADVVSLSVRHLRNGEEREIAEYAYADAP